MIKIITPLLLIIFIYPKAQAESFFRIRGIQASPLLTEKTERGVFKDDSGEIPMKTNPSETQSIMITYGIFGIGTSSFETSITSSSLEYRLKSNWFDTALIFDGPGNTSITIGTANLTSGKGVISAREGISDYSTSNLSSVEASGSSIFYIFGLEYTLVLIFIFH